LSALSRSRLKNNRRKVEVVHRAEAKEKAKVRAKTQGTRGRAKGEGVVFPFTHSPFVGLPIFAGDVIQH
jgi:hypothetical protein